MKGDGLEDRPQLVVAIGAPTAHAKIEIQLRMGLQG